jgi:hypothetical protein
MAIIARIAVGVVNVRDLVPESKPAAGRIETRLAPVHALQRAEPPWSEERRDPRGPRPFAHAVEALAVLHLVAVDELLVGQDVAVRVHDALREPGRSRRVIELRGILGRGVAGSRLVEGRERVSLQDEHRPRVGEARALSARDRHRPRLRAVRPWAPFTRGTRRFQRGRRLRISGAATALEQGNQRPMRRLQLAKHVGRLVPKVLQLSPRQLPVGAVEALPHHRELVARVLVTDV